MKITFLGTSSMIPTADRNHNSILFDYENEHILIDCGEGTQRQFRIGNINPVKITKILITHWHGDHVLGLPGLLQNLSRHNYNKTLEVYGPKGTANFFKNMFSWFYTDVQLKIKIKEVEEGVFFENEYFILKATKLNHRVPCLGYSFIEKDKRKININYLKKFGLTNNPIIADLIKGKDIVWNKNKIKAKDATFVEKGKKFVYLLDSAYSKHLENFCKGADLLLCEATFADDMKEFAKEFGHMTAGQAATLAKKANVKKLIITHFSQRYKDTNVLLKEARKIFSNTIAARDLMQTEI
ncbi:MAG TPA: ribonuclease Z [Nanoarchaeota archaeon]|nr:ribonuclease Z [Nanoarchaeota archaeon]